ncbi:hypothetical protein PSPO01_10267 [Paraphaeosphaeria sporulosa]
MLQSSAMWSGPCRFLVLSTKRRRTLPPGLLLEAMASKTPNRPNNASIVSDHVGVCSTMDALVRRPPWRQIVGFQTYKRPKVLGEKRSMRLRALVPMRHARIAPS